MRSAVATVLGPGHAARDLQVRSATRPEFGHYQTSLPLRLAGPVADSPRRIAERLVERLDVEDVCLPPAVQGAGFINFTLRPDFLARRVNEILRDAALCVPRGEPQRVVVDFSSPNVAKQMHVGHLRSTVLGDVLARVLAFVGHDVVRQNHLGDWGTQFGMLIEDLLEEGHDGADLDLAGLDAAYRSARTRFEADAGFAVRARARVVLLQGGDRGTLAVWRRLVATSLTAFDEVYVRLGVELDEHDVAGESRYNADLPRVVDDLLAAGLLTESAGALCAFLPGFTTRDGSPLPLLVRKADGGFGYDATDLAALRYRVEELRADRLVYVVDVRQSLHFEQVFALARAAGWLPERVATDHVAFGTVLGEDGKPFKTRTGATVPLVSLLDAAQERATALLDDRGSTLQGAAREETARAVGVGAVRYGDLVNGLGRDYVFALDRMVAMDGNTGPYLQYAHARSVSLLARAGGSGDVVTLLREPAERRLAFAVTGFPGAVAAVAETLQPHRLCAHLHQVATALSSFYEACPVLSAEAEVRASRLALCRAAQRVLAVGLELLGIRALERM
nr:arginine--tRNA ligase [Kineococcus vitellinus]